MQKIRKQSDILLFSLFVAIVVIGALALNAYDVRSAPAQDSLIPLDTSFTYQGYLEDGDTPIDESCNFRFVLYNAATGGSQVGSTNSRTLSVNQGVFSTKLDFGNTFATQQRWLEVQVRCPAGSGSFTTLTPRTEITASPLANTMPGIQLDPNTGYIGINSNTLPYAYRLDVNGTIRSKESIYVTTASGGQRVVLNNSGSVSVLTGSASTRASMYVNSSAEGVLSIRDSAGNERIFMNMTGTDAGYIETEGPNGSDNVRLTSTGGNNGYISAHDSSANDKASLFVDSGDGVGTVVTRGTNGNRNTALSHSSAGANAGWMGVYDSSGNVQASVYVNDSGQGVVFGDIKNFRMKNPEDENTEIWYASLEGPEAGAYIRGTAQLVNGQAIITFPDHFLSVASETNLTVQVTPLSADSMGLAVTDKSLDGIVVQELFQGTGTYEFDYIVTAVRQGYEGYEVIRSAEKFSSDNLDTATDSAQDASDPLKQEGEGEGVE